jgi:uncharacterized membrane protein
MNLTRKSPHQASAADQTPTITPADEPPLTFTEKLISVILRAGVVLAVAVILLGVAVAFAHHHDYLTSADALRHLKAGNASFPRTPAAIVRGIAAFRGEAIIAAGLVILLATPILRVAVSIVAFVEEGDRGYVLITSTVLALLIASLVLGRAGG